MAGPHRHVYSTYADAGGGSGVRMLSACYTAETRSLPSVTGGGATPVLLRVGLEPRWSQRPAGPRDTHEVLPAYAGWSEDVAGEEFFGCVLLAYAG